MTGRIRISVSLFLLALCLSDTANAADRKGFSISAMLGRAEVEDKDGTATFRGSDLGFAFDFGYRYSFVEFGLNFYSLGTTEDTVNGIDTRIEARGNNLYGRAIFPLSDRSEIYGRIGTGAYVVTVEPGVIDLDDPLELGIGIDFARNERLAFRIEGRFLNSGNDEQATMLLAGVNFLF